MSSIGRPVRRVLAVAAIVAGMLLGFGLTDATAGPDNARAPKPTAHANLVLGRIQSVTIVNVSLDPDCTDYGDDSGYGDNSYCYKYPDPPKYVPPKPHQPPKPHIPPLPPRVCQGTVPNVVGRTEDEAREALAAVGLTAGSDRPGNNRVMRQVPTAGTVVQCGWVVTVIVDQPAPPPPAPPPPLPLVELPPADPPPAFVLPSPLPVVPPAVPVPRVEPIPWFWPVIIALLGLSAVLLVGLLLLVAARAWKGPKWVRAHFRAVAGVAPGVGVEVMELPTDHSAPPCVVRLEPHADSGTQILEEVH
jgi:PASTA domain